MQDHYPSVVLVGEASVDSDVSAVTASVVSDDDVLVVVFAADESELSELPQPLIDASINNSAEITAVVFL